MTPDQISAISAIAQILEKIGTMPIFSLVTVILIGPWVAMFLLTRGQEKRFDAMKKMYENNVELVKCYEDLAKGMQDLVIYNTQTMTARWCAEKQNQPIRRLKGERNHKIEDGAAVQKIRTDGT
jgi:hypothetical protein